MKKRIDIPPMAIVIVSYNNKDLTISCIESIRANNDRETYKIIVVDNASTDGIVKWLSEQDDITLITNKENKGFPYACNQGIAAADSGADILLLNNDTIVPENALHWLREGLYSDECVGATGSISNNVVNYQQVSEKFETLDEWMDFAKQNNVEMDYPYERKGWLVGFAMLIRRTAINKILSAEGKENDEIPEVLDCRFSPGNYEDNDLSIRLLKNGFELLLCKNSFIYHYGGKSFEKHGDKYIKLLLKNQEKLKDKYGIDYVPYSYIETALIDMIRTLKDDFYAMEIGCRLGATLARIKSKYPHCNVTGVEKNDKLVELASRVTDVKCEDILNIDISASGYEERFDYVILDRILKNDGNYREILQKAKECAKIGGELLLSIDNRQCIRANDKGFTLDEIVEMFNNSGLELKEFNYRSLNFTTEERERLCNIMKNKDESMRPLYAAERFIFSAKRMY